MKQLWKSFRLTFLRRPDGLDLFWCLLLFGAYFVCHSSLTGVFWFAFCVFIFPRSVVFLLDYALNRWPERAALTFSVAPYICGIPFFLWVGFAVFSIDWASVAQMRPDWQGALWVLVMGAGAVRFLGPLMWILDRFFKPFAQRTGQHALSAVGFITLCGVWWSGLVLGLLVISGKGWW